jgi:hypothetical protein
MKLYRKYETDLQAEVEGVWVELAVGVRVKIGRWLNDNHVRILDKLKAPYRDQLRAGIPLEKDIMLSIASEAMAEAILLGWEGFEKEEGGELPYSKEEAIKALRSLRDFREDITSLSEVRATFNKYALEKAKQDLKNI